MADDFEAIKAAFQEYQEDNRPAGYAAAFGAGWLAGRTYQRQQDQADRAIADAARAWWTEHEAGFGPGEDAAWDAFTALIDATPSTPPLHKPSIARTADGAQAEGDGS